jgi:hypothetical protein
MAKKRTAVEKRDQAREPEVKVLETAAGTLFPPGRMLIASPLVIAEVVEKIPEGSVLRLSELREGLARRFAADYTCPLTTSMFLRIAADAAEEEGDEGRNTPYWRVVHDDGRLIDKLPGGAAAQARRLMEEGVVCRQKGKTWRLG